MSADVAVNYKTARTLAGLRETLFDELDRLRAGTIDQRRVRSTCDLAKSILTAAQLQLAYEKAWHEKKISDKLRTVELVPKLGRSE